MNKRYKILIITNDSGGLFLFREELLRKLILFCEVVISTPCTEKIEDIEQIGCRIVETKVDRRGMNPIKDLVLVMSYLKILKKEKPDIILSYTIKPNMYGGIVARYLNIPFFPYVAGLGTPFQNSNIISKILIFCHKLAFKKATQVFFENAETLEFYKNHGIVGNNIVKLPGAGVNLKKYTYKEMPNKEYTEFVFVGRLMREKGIEELISATIKIKSVYPETVVNIVGPYEEKYEDKIKQLSNIGIIKFWGFQEDVRPIVYNSHCLILPSYHEGMANVLLEAAAMGRILITSNIHGCLEAVEQGENGYLVKVRDEKSLYYAMEKVIQLSLKEKQYMGMRSRSIVENSFDRNIVVDRMLDILFSK